MEIASRQHMCFTRSQALLIMSRRQFEAFIRRGDIERVWPRTYRVAGTPDTWEQRLMAVVLSCPGSVASHRSAARLHGLETVPSVKLEITVIRGRAKKRKGVTMHESEQLDRFVTVVNGIPVTTVPRTMTDLTLHLPERRLSPVVDEVLRKNLASLPQMRLCLDVMKTKGRRKITSFRNLLDMRNVTDEAMDTELEKMALAAIRAAGFPEPSAKGFVIVNGSRYEPDLWYPDFKTIIEPGGPHHLLPTVAANDRKRDADFQIDGWVVITFLYDTDPAVFIEQLHRARARRSMRKSDTK